MKKDSFSDYMFHLGVLLFAVICTAGMLIGGGMMLWHRLWLGFIPLGGGVVCAFMCIAQYVTVLCCFEDWKQGR